MPTHTHTGPDADDAPPAVDIDGAREHPDERHQPTTALPTIRPQLPADAAAYATAAPDDADTNPPTVVSTFCGPGGSSLGYEYAGYDVRAAIDYAPGKFSDAIPDTYRANHPDTPFLERDITDLDADTILDAAGLDRGDLDVLDGSPPCSPFSNARSQKDWQEYDSATLFDDYARLVDALEPRAFVAENVPRLAQGKTKGYFKYLCGRLRDAGPGYTLTVFRFDATALGAGHHRRRLLFIGTRADQPDPPSLSPSQCYSPRRVADSWVNVPNTPAAVTTGREMLERRENYHAYTRLSPGDSLAVETDTCWSHYRLAARTPAPTIINHAAILPPTEHRMISIPELKRLIGIPDAYDLVTDNATELDYYTAMQLCIRCLPPELLETIGRALRARVLSPDAFLDADTATETLAARLGSENRSASVVDGEFTTDRFIEPHQAACLMAAQQRPDSESITALVQQTETNWVE